MTQNVIPTGKAVILKGVNPEESHEKRSFGFHPQDDTLLQHGISPTRHCETRSVEAIQERDTSGSALSMTSKSQKAAFTLAEVLITLGIIGIVAAMTLPTLINKYKEQEIITRVKKTYTSIAQALELVQAANETPGDNSILFSKEKSSAEITKELSKYFSGAKYCEAGANAAGCKNLNYKIKYSIVIQNPETSGAQLTNMTSYPRIVLNNGAVIGVSTRNSDCAEYTATGDIVNSDGSIALNPDGSPQQWTQTRNNCGVIVFDVNGSQLPNQFGYDAYAINVYKTKIGHGYWNANGTDSLKNILAGRKNPLVYTKYSESDVFEW